MSDVDQVVEDAGSVEATEAAGSGEQSVGDAGGSDLPEFRDFTWKDGDKEYRFNRRAELADFMNQRLGKASQAYQQYQDRMKRLEQTERQRQTEYEARQQAFTRWQKIDEAMNSNPHVKEAIEKAFQEAMSRGKQNGIANDPALKELMEFKQRMEQTEQQRQAEARRQQAFSQLKGRYEDFDDRAILAEINRLQETPSEKSEEALYELVYYAMKGKMTPAEIEKKFAESKVKRPPSVTSTPGRTQGGFDPTKMSRSERAAKALEMLGGE